MSEEDPPVLVIDLRAEALAADRVAHGSGSPAPPMPADEPLAEEEQVRGVAILHDGSARPLLLPIEPTSDRRWLDAVARLLRFAVLQDRSVAEVATRYGSEYERRLVFERRLPRWIYEGAPPEAQERIPSALRRALGGLGRR